MDMGLLALLNAHVSSGFFAQGWQLLVLGAGVYSRCSPIRRPDLAIREQPRKYVIAINTGACILLAVFYGSCTWEIFGSAGF